MNEATPEDWLIKFRNAVAAATSMEQQGAGGGGNSSTCDHQPQHALLSTMNTRNFDASNSSNNNLSTTSAAADRQQLLLSVQEPQSRIDYMREQAFREVAALGMNNSSMLTTAASGIPGLSTNNWALQQALAANGGGGDDGGGGASHSRAAAAYLGRFGGGANAAKLQRLWESGGNTTAASYFGSGGSTATTSNNNHNSTAAWEDLVRRESQLQQLLRLRQLQGGSASPQVSSLQEQLQQAALVQANSDLLLNANNNANLLQFMSPHLQQQILSESLGSVHPLLRNWTENRHDLLFRALGGGVGEGGGLGPPLGSNSSNTMTNSLLGHKKRIASEDFKHGEGKISSPPASRVTWQQQSPLTKKPRITGSSQFPLPTAKEATTTTDDTAAPPKIQLLSFQRLWGKLNDKNLQDELFRRRLHAGDYPLTGRTRSSILQEQRKTTALPERK